jgi:PST family polysaccharide transporter
VLLAAAFWLSAEPVAKLYETPELAPVVRWLSAVLPLRGLATVPVGLLQRHFRFRVLAIRSIFGAVAGGVAGVVAAFAGWGVYALVVQQIVAGLVDVVTVWSAAAWRPRFAYSRRHLRELVGFSAHIVGAGLLDVLNRRSGDFLIGFFLGDVALGLYAVAYRVLLVLTQVLAKPGTLVAFTAFSRLQDDRDRMRAAFYQSTQAASVISIPIFVGIALVAPIAVPLVFGEKYGQSGLVLQLLALAGVVHAISYYNSSVYLGVGRPDVRLKLLVINTVVHVAVLFWVVRWGIEAVAAAVVVQVYLLVPLDLVALRGLIGVSPKRYFANFIPAAAASALMAVAVIGVLASPFGVLARLVLATVGGGLVYCVSLFVIAPELVRGIWTRVKLAVQAAD